MDVPVGRIKAGQLLIVGLILGLLLRGYHYLREPSLWQDEAAMVVNLLQLNFADFFGPLKFHSPTPPLYLASIKFLLVLFGDSLAVLRWVSFLSAIVSMLLLTRVAWLLLTGWRAVVAVWLFAVSDSLLWHACEAKPYSWDVGLAIGLIWLTVESQRRGGVLQENVAALLLAPLMIWFSYPALFLACAWWVRLVLITRGRMLFVLAMLTLALAVSAGALITGSIRAQRTTEMESCWIAGFPDWSAPQMVPVWSLLQMAEVVRYIVMPWGNGFFLPIILGCWQWHRREGLPSLVVLLGPIVLALGAAYLGKYPFCAARVLAYSAPAVVLLIAAGMPSVMWMPVFPGFRRIWQGLWILYLVTAVGYTGYRCVIPWTRPASDTASAYVLNHSQSDSLIIWNHWDYEYYFRHVGEERKCSCYQGEFTHGGPWPDEVWVLYTSIHRPEECPLAPPANYKLAERIDFTMTSCFHFRRVP